MPGARTERTFETSGCRLLLVTEGAVLGARAAGHLDLAAAQHMASGLTAQRKGRARAFVFLDWWDIEGYDTEARRYLTEYKKQRQRQEDTSLILVRSKIVAMGVAAASAILGGTLKATADRTAFSDELRQRLRAEGSTSWPGW
jgi:hypothetical protein